MRARRRVGLALVLWAIPTLCSAQGAYLRLRIVDAATFEPIVGAAVNFPELELYALSDAAGVATVRGIPPGNHAIEVTMLGYGPGTARIHLEAGAIGTGEIALTSEPIQLAGIVVNGRRTWSEYLDRTGYYQRAEAGSGYHFEREDIRRTMAQQPSELLRYMPISGIQSGGCPWTLWIDGVRTMKGKLDDQLIGWIEGIEVFPRRVEVPIEFVRPDTCRTILVWTGVPGR